MMQKEIDALRRMLEENRISARKEEQTHLKENKTSEREDDPPPVKESGSVLRLEAPGESETETVITSSGIQSNGVLLSSDEGRKELHTEGKV